MHNEITKTENTKAPVEGQWMQVWAIVIGNGILLAPIDDDGCECFMAFPTKEDAETALNSQLDKGYIDEDDTVRVQRVA